MPQRIGRWRSTAIRGTDRAAPPCAASVAGGRGGIRGRRYSHSLGRRYPENCTPLADSTFMLSDSTILKHLAHQPRRSAGFKQLVRELGLHGSARRELDDRLQKLVASGQLTRSDSDHYALPQASPNKNLVAGRLTMHRDGFGFVIPDANSISPSFRSRLVGDIFIAPHQLGNAMHSEQVLVAIVAIRPDGRAEGGIVRSVERAHSTVVGIFHYGSRHNYAKAIDSKITQEIVIPPGMEIPLGQVSQISSPSSVTTVAGSEGEGRPAHRTDGTKR